jgi:hypothetical protein
MTSYSVVPPPVNLHYRQQKKGNKILWRPIKYEFNSTSFVAEIQQALSATEHTE